MEFAEPLMGCNFPELLAGDLSRSEAVFLSRHLTAGAPAPSLLDDGSRRRNSLQDTSMRQLKVPSDASRDRSLSNTNSRSLQAADQAYSQLFVLSYDRASKRRDSTSSSESSVGAMMPPSVAVRTRDLSVTTTATSLSDRFSPESRQPVSSSPESRRSAGSSWMDLEMENCLDPVPDCLVPGRASCIMPNFDHAAASPPRPRSRRSDDGDQRSTSMESNGKPLQSRQSDHFDQFEAFSQRLASPTSPTSMASLDTQRAVPAPKRKSHSNHKNYTRPSESHRTRTRTRPGPSTPPSPSDSTPSPKSTPKIAPKPSRTPPPPPDQESAKEEAGTPDDSGSTFSSEAEAESEMEDMLEPLRDHATPKIVAPHINVERWLESSIDTVGVSYRPGSSNDTTSGIPLPPDVLDTLRISVSCFPETMLLCSSLSIETIRSHSRKVKYSNSMPQMPLEGLPDDPAKPSVWKWLTKKPDPAQNRLQARHMATYPEPRTTALGSAKSTSNDWSAVKNIFPTGSDFLCDALYAHILAYNYITSLCPRPGFGHNAAGTVSRPGSKAKPESRSRPGSKSSAAPHHASRKSNDSDGTKIPRKAASFLGLHNDPSTMPDLEPPTSPRARNKPSFAGKGSRTFSSLPTRAADANDQSLRDLRIQLAKCVARLVATLLLASDVPSGGVVPKSAEKQHEVDPMFMRALCEVVRCSEEQ